MSMKKSKSIDLTSGPILKTLSELALPIMASSLLGTAYNITDMAWIGLLGSKAVAGVGVGGMYVWLSQGLVALPRMGGQVNTAQSCGRKDYKEARSYAASALQMTILFGLLFAAASIIFLDPLIGFFNLTDPEAYSSARSRCQHQNNNYQKFLPQICKITLRNNIVHCFSNSCGCTDS